MGSLNFLLLVCCSQKRILWLLKSTWRSRSGDKIMLTFWLPWPWSVVYQLGISREDWSQAFNTADNLMIVPFDIGDVYGWSIFVLKKWNFLLSVFSVGHPVLIIERYWQRYDQKNDRTNSDLIGTHHFIIYIWVFPLGYIKDKLLVNCGGFPGDCRSIHGITSYLKCSEDEEGLF